MTTTEKKLLLSLDEKKYAPSLGEVTLTSPSTIMQGVLYIRTGFIFKTWKPYYCILKKNCLFYKKSQSSKRISGFIDLKRTSIWDASNDENLFLSQKHAFMIYHPLRKTIYLKSESEFKTKQWIKALMTVRELGRIENEETELYTSSDEEEQISICGKFFRIPFKLPNILKHKGIVKEYVFQEVEKDVTNKLKLDLPSVEPNTGITKVIVEEAFDDSITMVSLKFSIKGDARKKISKLCQYVEEEFPELKLRIYGIE